MILHTILGANSIIGTELISVLHHSGADVRTVSSNPYPVHGQDHHVIDFLNYEEVVHAVAGSSYVYLILQLPYRTQTWKEEWPPIMRHCINACKEAYAKLIFLDNSYMYGKAGGVITEQTPYEPIGEKGQVRAMVASLLQEEMNKGSITGSIARSASLYGPGVVDRNTVGHFVFGNLIKGRKPKLMANPDVPRSLSYLPDVASALYILATHDTANGKVWHVPTARPALTGRAFASLAASCLNVRGSQVKVWYRWEYAIAQLFDSYYPELDEMKRMEQSPFLFDSSQFEFTFQFTPTPYMEGIKATADWFRVHYR